MIKFVFSLKRKPGMSEEEFHDYWLNQHGPLVREYKDAFNIRRYVQVHLADTDLNDGLASARGSEPRYFDGVAELWWDSEQDLLAALDSPEAQAGLEALIEDEARFIDLENSPVWMGYEHEIIG